MLVFFASWLVQHLIEYVFFLVCRWIMVIFCFLFKRKDSFVRRYALLGILKLYIILHTCMLYFFISPNFVVWINHCAAPFTYKVLGCSILSFGCSLSVRRVVISFIDVFTCCKCIWRTWFILTYSVTLVSGLKCFAWTKLTVHCNTL